MQKIKEILKKIGKALWSKPFLLALVIALAGALGYALEPEQAGKIICMLPLVEGC